MGIKVKDDGQGVAGLGQVGDGVNVVGHFLRGVIGFLFRLTAIGGPRSVYLAPTDGAVLVENVFMGGPLSWAFGPGPAQSLSTNFIRMISIGHKDDLQKKDRTVA